MQLVRSFPLLIALISSSGSTCRSSSGAGQPSGGGEPSADITLEGVDTGSLTPRERREWSTYVSELLAPCPSEPVSIAQCVKESRPCNKCLSAARLLVRQVREGRSRSQAEDAYRARFSPDKVRLIDMSDSPSLGPASVPVNIVEWADFECPHCRHAAPILEKLVEQFPGQVRFMFKFYPLQAHAHAESAARAAVAAMNQGKFWQMHHALFEHQEALEPRDVELYAKQLGLDMAKFKADLDSEATADRVARDRKQGDALALSGTPTVYINGREYDLTKFDMADDLQDWIKLEIDLGTAKTPQGEPARSTAPSRASDAGTGGARASKGKTP